MLDNVSLKELDFDLAQKGLPSSSNQIKLTRKTFDSVRKYWNKARFSFLKKTVEVAKKVEDKISSIVDRMEDKIMVSDMEKSSVLEAERPIKVKKFMFKNIRSNSDVLNHEAVKQEEKVETPFREKASTTPAMESTVPVIDLSGSLFDPPKIEKTEEIDVVKTAENANQLANDVEKTMSDEKNFEVPDVPVVEEKKENTDEVIAKEEMIHKKDIDEIVAKVMDEVQSKEQKSNDDFEIPKNVHDRSIFENVSDAVTNKVVSEKDDEDFEKISKSSGTSIKMNKFDEEGNVKETEEKEEVSPVVEKPVYNYKEMTDEEISKSQAMLGIKPTVTLSPMFLDPVFEEEEKKEVSEEKKDTVIRGGDETVIVPDVKPEERFVSEKMEEAVPEEKVVIDEDIPSYTTEVEEKKEGLHFDFSEATQKDFDVIINNTNTKEELKDLQKLVLESNNRLKAGLQRQNDTKKNVDAKREKLRLTNEEFESMKSHTGELQNLLVKKIEENNTYAAAIEEDCAYNEKEALKVDEEMEARNKAIADEVLLQQQLNDLLASLGSGDSIKTR